MGKIDVSKLKKIRQKCGLETDSGSRWHFLVNHGLSSIEAEHKVFEEKGFIKGNRINAKNLRKCRK
jgi:hypothetical protein